MAHVFVYLAVVADWSTGIDPHGGRFLHRGAGRGSGETWQIRNLQRGSGQPIHQRRVHRHATQKRHRHQPLDRYWTARVRGVTMFLSSGFGDGSNARRSISEHTIRCPRLDLRSAPIWVFIIAEGQIPASTGGRPARPTSTGDRVPRRRNGRIGIVALGRQRMQCEGCGHDALRAT